MNDKQQLAAMGEHMQEANAAKIMHDTQMKADRFHHEANISFLSAVNCRWGDGSIMAEHDRLTLLARNTECLRLINEHGMSTNGADTQYKP